MFTILMGLVLGIVIAGGIIFLFDTNYVQLQWIEKWDGKLPTTVLGGDTKTMMNIGK
jgi:hypothetical protein